MNNTSIIANTKFCPKCKWETNNGGFEIRLKDDKIDGDYCLKCWAKKQLKDIPKLKDIKK